MMQFLPCLSPLNPVFYVSQGRNRKAVFLQGDLHFSWFQSLRLLQRFAPRYTGALFWRMMKRANPQQSFYAYPGPSEPDFPPLSRFLFGPKLAAGCHELRYIERCIGWS